MNSCAFAVRDKKTVCASLQLLAGALLIAGWPDNANGQNPQRNDRVVLSSPFEDLADPSGKP